MNDKYNHVHIEQLNSNDNLELNIDQIINNVINFSFDHANNTFNFTQKGQKIIQSVNTLIKFNKS